MLKFVKALLKKPDPPQTGLVSGKFYDRAGSCHGCGKCCTNIYLIHGDETIASVARFEELQALEPEYASFKPIGVEDDGVLFQCIHLQADNRCAIYEERPSFCRLYPSEKSLLMGGKLAENCGYQFHVKQPFNQVLSRVADKHRNKPPKAGKLLS